MSIRGLLKALLSFHALLIAGLVVVTVLTISHRFNDPDLWFHLKLGQVIWTTHSVPTTDTFSFTAYGHPWIPHEWLAQLGIYAAYRMGGYPGLMLGFAAVASLLFILMYVLCYRYCGNALVAFLGTICAWFFATVGLAIRPLLLGNVFLLIELILLDLSNRNRRWLWGLPPLFAIWVNCHGSYFFGMGVLFVYWLCSLINGQWGLVVSDAWEKESRKWLGVVLVLCGLALFCNPVGIRLVAYPLNVAFQQTTSMNAIDEWLPPDLRSARGLGMVIAILGIVLTHLLSRSEVRLRDMLLSALAFGLAVQHVRMLFVFGITVSPILCRAVAPSFGRDQKREHPVANAVLMTACAGVILWGLPNRASLMEQLRQDSPVTAVEYIRRSGLKGPMLNDYAFGGYLIWALPEETVFVDGRGDLFDWNGVLTQYGKWATLKDAPRALLDKYRIRLCLLAVNAPMNYVLPYLPGWKKVYSDDVAAIFVR